MTVARGWSVTAGVDMAAACDEVIEFAFEAARIRHARLRAVHAWHPPGPLGLGAGEIGLVDVPPAGRGVAGLPQGRAAGVARQVP